MTDALPFDDDTLRDYLAEVLAPPAMARVERALRDSATLRERLEAIRANRAEDDLHSLGAIWRRYRLTCPTREQLGSYLLEALDPDHAAYLAFHLDRVECPFCRANLEDLKRQSDHTRAVPDPRQRKIFHSSRHLLSGDDPTPRR